MVWGLTEKYTPRNRHPHTHTAPPLRGVKSLSPSLFPSPTAARRSADSVGLVKVQVTGIQTDVWPPSVTHTYTHTHTPTHSKGALMCWTPVSVKWIARCKGASWRCLCQHEGSVNVGVCLFVCVCVCVRARASARCVVVLCHG